jgi:DNA-binding CsgD family transcriptional regulator
MLSHAGAINRDIAAPVLGVIARHQGDAELAWSVVRDTFPHGSDTKPGDTYFVGYALVLQRVAVGLALDAGDLATARTWLEAHDRWLEWSDSVPGRSEGALLWARFHLASGDSEKAYEQAETALRLAGEPRQPLALLAAQRFLGELESAAQRYGEAGQYLLAVLTLTDACAAPFERALTLLALAELRLAEEKHDDARRFAGEARRICEPLDAKPTLTRADALLARLQRRAGGYPAGLTARDADVLRLIAQGLTDAEIAEQLFIAPRTVNTHVTSIYTKLNINTRAAATRLAIEHGLV